MRREKRVAIRQREADSRPIALVTGVAGFVGSRLASRLNRDGHRVVGIDALTEYYDPEIKRRNLAELDEGIRVVLGELETVDLDALLDGVSLVFHQAGQPGVRSSWGSGFAEYTRRNVDVTQRLLEAVSGESSIERFVFASSSSVYGDAERYPTVESDLPRPASPYGVTKLAAEHLVSLYGRQFGVPTVSLRYFTVYGPGQRPDMAFSRFIEAALGDRAVAVYGDGEQVRDFTFVDDVVEANVRAAETPTEPGSVFNVAGGDLASVAEVLAELEDIHGAPVRIQRKPPMPGDARRTGGDTSKIATELGWMPSVRLAEGLRRQYEHRALRASSPSGVAR